MSDERAAQREQDRLLVERARAGDKAAFTALMDRYQQRAYAVALAKLRSPDDAMDVVQEAFIKVHTHLGSFQGQSSFYTWLFRIVVNLCIDVGRRRARSKLLPLDEQAAHDEALAASVEVSPARPGTNPAKQAQDNELGRQLQAALDGLSEAHREILVLRELDGLSYEELAEVLDISKGTVMSRLFHARQNMQKALRPGLGLNEGAPLDNSAGRDNPEPRGRKGEQ